MSDRYAGPELQNKLGVKAFEDALRGFGPGRNTRRCQRHVTLPEASSKIRSELDDAAFI